VTETYRAATVDTGTDPTVAVSGTDRPLLGHQTAERHAVLDATGDPRVDDAMARLVDVDESPVGEHLDIYQDVHRRLHEALADLDGR
jgi:hypothetical protein